MRKKPLLIALAAIGLSGAAHAQYPVSPQQGILPVTISGTPANRFNLVASPFVKRCVLFFEATSAVSGTVVTSTSATFGDFTTLPHVLVLLSGSNRGQAAPIVANTGTTITTSDPFPSAPIGSEFVVVEEYTLDSLIGNGSTKPLPAGWASFSSFSTLFADRVILPNPTTGALQTYYFNTSASGWRLSTDPTTAQGNRRIPFGTGLFIQRASVSGTGSMTLDLEGELYVGLRRTKVEDADSTHNGSNIIANRNANAITLGNFGLVESGLAGGPSFTVFVDRVIIPDASGALKTYFYNTTLGVFNGTLTGTTSQNAVVIPAGGGAYILRTSATATSDFFHTTNQEFQP